MVEIILCTHITDTCNQDVITDRVGIGCHKTEIENLFVFNTFSDKPRLFISVQEKTMTNKRLQNRETSFYNDQILSQL